MLSVCGFFFLRLCVIQYFISWIKIPKFLWKRYKPKMKHINLYTKCSLIKKIKIKIECFNHKYFFKLVRLTSACSSKIITHISIFVFPHVILLSLVTFISRNQNSILSKKLKKIIWKNHLMLYPRVRVVFQWPPRGKKIIKCWNLHIFRIILFLI